MYTCTHTYCEMAQVSFCYDTRLKRSADMATSSLWPLPRIGTWIHTSILYLCSWGASIAVLRTVTRMAGRVHQMASDVLNHGDGGTRDKLTSLHPHLSISLERAVSGWGIAVVSQVPKENILAPYAWRTCSGGHRSRLPNPQPQVGTGTLQATPLFLLHRQTFTATRTFQLVSPLLSQQGSPASTTIYAGAITQWFVMYWNIVYIAKTLICPWKAIKSELHMSVTGFAPRADVLLADVPPTSRSRKLCSTSEPQQGEGLSCSWSARLIFMRPFSGNKKYGKERWSSPAAAGVDYGAGSSRNALRKAPSNG